MLREHIRQPIVRAGHEESPHAWTNVHSHWNGEAMPSHNVELYGSILAPVSGSRGTMLASG